MVNIVALFVPWCGRVEVSPRTVPQLNSDNLDCSVYCSQDFVGAARFTVKYVKAVGQDISFVKCVLLSISKVVRKASRALAISGDGRPWSVMFGILVIPCILPQEIVRVLCSIGYVLPLMVSKLLVLCPWSSGLSSGWSGLCIFPLLFMLLKRRMCLFCAERFSEGYC